jgi:glycerophosphoryl diester phosphodiesterase
MDIHQTKDGVFVLMHDNTIDRTTNGSGAVSDLTLAEIQSFFLYYPDGTLSNLKVPTLQDTLLALKGKCLMMLDKSNDYFDEIAELARNCGVVNQIILKSSKTTSEMVDVLENNPDVYYGAGTISQGKYEDSIENLPLEMISISYSETNSWLVSSAAQALSDSYDVRVWNNSLDSTPNSSAGHTDSQALIDPDGNWGWQIGHGIDIIQTDEISALRDYLLSLGKYK